MLASARRCRLPSQTRMWTRTDKTHGGTCIIAIAKKASARGSCSHVCRRASGGVAWINMYTVYVMEVPLLAQSVEALVITACSFAAHGFAAHGAASVWCLGQMQYLQLHITMSMQVLQVLVSSCQDPVQSAGYAEHCRSWLSSSTPFSYQVVSADHAADKLHRDGIGAFPA